MRPYLLKGHERPLTQVKYNREGDLLVSCAKNLYCCLWSGEDGTRIGTYEGHNGAVWTCDISMDSQRLITASADQTVRIWDLPTGGCLHVLKMNEPCRASALSIGERHLAFTTDSFMGAPPQIHIVDVDLQVGGGVGRAGSMRWRRGCRRWPLTQQEQHQQQRHQAAAAAGLQASRVHPRCGRKQGAHLRLVSR